jgi:hypothetical protein
MIDLIMLLQQKEKVALQIYENTKQQTVVIEAEDGDHLLELLEQRENMFKQVHEIDEALQGKEDQDNPLWQKNREIFTAAYELDCKNWKMLELQKNELSHLMQQNHAVQKAVSSGYMKQGSQAYGYFIDKKN